LKKDILLTNGFDGYTLPSTSLPLSKLATANAANFFPTLDLPGEATAGYESRREYVLPGGQVRSFNSEAFELFASQNPESGTGRPVSNLFCALDKVLENIASFGERFVGDKGRFFRLERISGDERQRARFVIAPGWYTLCWVLLDAYNEFGSTIQSAAILAQTSRDSCW
jgi:hypothetical protein